MAGETKPRQFRLNNDTLAELDAIKLWLEEETGSAQTRSDAIRYAARQAKKRIDEEKKSKRQVK